MARMNIGAALAVVVAIACAGCTDVSGGAVELSWLLRPSNGDENACSEQSCCQDSRVTQIQLNWSVDGNVGFDAWPCEDNRAVTNFVLPPGEASLWVTPECSYGPAASAAYEAPPPVVRTVVAGDVVSLNAVVVQVLVAGCQAPDCICQAQ